MRHVNYEKYIQNLYAKLNQILTKGYWSQMPEFEIEMDPDTNAICVEFKKFPELFIYATPFWEGEAGLRIDVTFDAGCSPLWSKTYDFEVEGDIEKDAYHYIDILRDKLAAELSPIEEKLNAEKLGEMQTGMFL